ncbi:hypothetical protein ACJZ2D_017002 [Fusarium nematophilum]
MDQIKALGSDLLQTIAPSYKMLGDILNEPDNASAIRATKRETFSYGAHERHNLDVYTPSPSTPNPAGDGPRPVFLFVYGGGFATGAKNLPDVEGDLVYANIGSFIADRLGFETIIIDYTLVHHGARYPSGGNELDMAINWLERRDAGKRRRDIYVMGNSAGGVHVFTWLLEQPFQQTVQRLTAGQGVLKLKALLPLGSPFRWPEETAEYRLRGALIDYYGDKTRVVEEAPVRVLEKVVSGYGGERKWPPVLVIVSELDPDYIKDSGLEFLDIWKKAGGTGTYWVLEGHNHLSPALTLGTQTEELEKWGYELGERIQELK